MAHTDLIRYSAEGVKETCEQGKANGLTAEPEAPESNPFLTKLELNKVGAHRRNEDAGYDFDRKRIPEEHVGP